MTIAAALSNISNSNKSESMQQLLSDPESENDLSLPTMEMGTENEVPGNVWQNLNK